MRRKNLSGKLNERENLYNGRINIENLSVERELREN